MPEPQQPTEPTEVSFGQELKKEREIRGITLREIADSTKISKRFLEAIERNDFDTLPAPVFTRGFIREYARYLGLNPDDMVNRYMHFVSSQKPKDEWIAPSRERVVDRPQPASSFGSNKAIVIVATIVIGVAAIGFILRGVGQRREAAEVRPSEAAIATPPTVTAPMAQPVTGLTMEMRILEDTWIALDIDGTSALNEVLRSGDQRTVKAESEIRFRSIGNAGGMELTINGIRLPLLGESGEVLEDVVYNEETIRNLRGTP